MAKPAATPAATAVPGGEPPPLIGPAQHPRARNLIFAAKAWGGLAGFLVTLAAGTLAGTPLFDAALRALAGGVVCYLVAWGAALSISRALMRAEAQTAVEAVLAARKLQIEAIRAAAAAKQRSEA
jgi:hypothetical protein